MADKAKLFAPLVQIPIGIGGTQRLPPLKSQSGDDLEIFYKSYNLELEMDKA